MAVTAMDVLRQLRNNYPQLLLLYGLEEMLIEEVIRKYREEYQPDDFNYIRASLEEIEVEALEQLIYSPPMFAEFKLVIIENFEIAFSKKEYQEKIIESFNGIVETMTKIILISKESPDKRTKLYKMLNDLGVVAESKYLSTNEKYQWLKRELKRRKLQMQRDVEQEFILTVGDSLRDLTNELGKVQAYMADKDRYVLLNELRDIVTPSLESSIFRCVDALGHLDKHEAYQELQRLFLASEPPLRILAMIIRQIRLIYQTRLLIDQKSSLDNIRRELKTPSFVAKKLYDQAMNFDVETIKDKLKSLRELEGQIKTGQVDPSYAIEMWMLGLK